MTMIGFHPARESIRVKRPFVSRKNMRNVTRWFLALLPSRLIMRGKSKGKRKQDEKK